MRTPFPAFSPELLARIAQAAHRPPGAGGAPGLPGMQAPQGGGMGLSEGMAGLGMGLANWRPGGAPMGSSATTQAPGFGAGLGSSGEDMLAEAHRQWMAQNAGDPTIAGYGSGASSGGIGSWLRGLF